MPQIRSDKVALVTGAGRGIGRCIAGRLLTEGYAVVLADVDGASAAEAAAELLLRNMQRRGFTGVGRQAAA